MYREGMLLLDCHGYIISHTHDKLINTAAVELQGVVALILVDGFNHGFHKERNLVLLGRSANSNHIEQEVAQLMIIVAEVVGVGQLRESYRKLVDSSSSWVVVTSWAL